MERRTKGRPDGWPLRQKALTADDLKPYLPASATAASQAHSLGLLSDAELFVLVRNKQLATTSEMLEIFVRTAHYIDRRRDIREELERLSLFERDSCPTLLWMILARLVIDTRDTPGDAIRDFEIIFDLCDNPEALRPFTLYSSRKEDRSSSPKEAVSRLNSLLVARGL
jgi:hypothetical protein